MSQAEDANFSNGERSSVVFGVGGVCVKKSAGSVSGAVTFFAAAGLGVLPLPVRERAGEGLCPQDQRFDVDINVMGAMLQAARSRDKSR